MRPKRAAVENVEPLQITPSFTKKFEDMVAGDKLTCQPDPVVFVKTHKTGGKIEPLYLKYSPCNLLVTLPAAVNGNFSIEQHIFSSKIAAFYNKKEAL